MKKIRIFHAPWHIPHTHQLLNIPNTEWLLLQNNVKRWNCFSRPVPDNTKWVPYYKSGSADIAILDVDQQCIDPRIGKGQLYRDLNKSITDIPKIVINHGTPCWPERWESAGHKRWTMPLELNNAELKDTLEYQRNFLVNGGKTTIDGETVEIEGMKKILGDNTVVVNSHKSKEQWECGKVIIHGLDPEEWWDLPKSPRSVSMISTGGLDYYYGRDFLNSTINRLAEDYGLKHTWISHPGSWTIWDSPILAKDGGWDAYRDFLGRSMIFFNPTRESCMPRSRTEAMMCLKPDSKVIMANDFSVKKIKHISIGDRIINKEGKETLVQAIHTKNTKELLYSIKINGYENIECSGDHKFYAIKSSKTIKGNGAVSKPYSRETKYKKEFNALIPEFIKARDICVGDMVLSPIIGLNDKQKVKIDVDSEKVDKRDGFVRWKGCLNNLEQVCNDYGIGYSYAKEKIRTKEYNGKKIINFVDWLKSGNYTKIGYFPEYLEVNDDLARFIGYFLAEGHIEKSTINFYFHRNESVYHQDVVKLGKKLFGINFKINIRDNKATISGNNRLIAEFIKKECGNNSLVKKIPSWLITNDKSITVNLIAGLYRGDGYIGSEACYTTISENLAYQIHFVLRSIGIISNISTVENMPKMKHKRYNIRSNAEHKDSLHNIVDKLILDIPSNHNLSSFIHDNNLYSRITKIETREYDGDVWDITTDCGDYLVNGFVTHNSGSCILTTAYQDEDKFITGDIRPLWASSSGVKDFISNIDSCIKEVEINGFIVPENPLAVSSLINYLIYDNPKECLRIGQRGKQTAIKLFNKERFDRNWRQLLEKEISDYKK